MKRSGSYLATTAIPKDSDMLKSYQREARLRGIGLPTLFYQLLRDRYESMQGREFVLWAPREWREPATEVESVDQQELEGDNSNIKMAADEAMRLLGSEDE